MKRILVLSLLVCLVGQSCQNESARFSPEPRTSDQISLPYFYIKRDLPYFYLKRDIPYFYIKKSNSNQAKEDRKKKMKLAVQKQYEEVNDYLEQFFLGSKMSMFGKRASDEMVKNDNVQNEELYNRMTDPDNNSFMRNTRERFLRLGRSSNNGDFSRSNRGFMRLGRSVEQEQNHSDDIEFWRPARGKFLRLGRSSPDIAEQEED